MTPTQPSQAVEAAEREKFERSALTRHLDKSIGKDAWDRPQYTAPHVESLWAGWLARSALASQQEVAAPVSDSGILHIWDGFVSEPTASRPLTDGDKIAFARAVLAAAPTPPAVNPASDAGSSGHLAACDGGGATRWQPIETAPEDGTPIMLADIADGVVYDIVNGHFEVLAEDEDDGPWSLDGGKPTCSYVGRAAGTYFCCWLPGKEWESRWRFGPNSGYTHWAPAIPAPTGDGA